MLFVEESLRLSRSRTGSQIWRCTVRRNPLDAEIAYELSLLIENVYLVKLALAGYRPGAQ